MNRNPYRSRTRGNHLKPKHRAHTAREASWGNSWRRDSYSTRGISNAYYTRIAWLATALYAAMAAILIVSETPLWKMLYWLVPLGIVVLWLWRFIFYEWWDFFADLLYRERKRRRAQKANETVVGSYRPGEEEPDFSPYPKPAPFIFDLPGEQRDALLKEDPMPHQHLGMDWETYRKKKERGT